MVTDATHSLKDRFLQLDPFLLFFITCLSLLGLLSLYSAAGGSFSPWSQKQFIRLSMGFSALFIISMMDPRTIRSLSFPAYILSILLLIFVDLKGHIGMGAQRWIDLKIIHLQPSELMKITLIMALATYFHAQDDVSLGRLRTYILPCVLIALPCALVLRQPDLGTTLILLSTGAFMIFMAGIRTWKVVTALLLALGSLPLLWMNMHAYQKKRVLTFLNPEQDPLGAGYHIMQSKIAIGSAGFWGKGFLHGTQSQLQFLPEKHTDFIFAHFIEEFGFAGGIFLIGLFGMVLITLLKMSLECKSYYARLYIVGFQALLCFYIFINIGMVMGLLPVVGVPLPFMSYGGTSLLTLLAGVGIALSCHVHRNMRFGQTYS